MKKDEYEQVIKSAQKKDPGNSFVSSCRDFLSKHGYLSQKQMSSLNNVQSYAERKRFLANTKFTRGNHGHHDPDWSTNEVGW